MVVRILLFLFYVALSVSIGACSVGGVDSSFSGDSSDSDSDDSDNQNTSKFNFDSSTSSVAEDVAGNSKEIIVSLSAALTDTVTVDYLVNASSSTATGGGDDYTLADGTLTFAAGDTLKTITVAIVDDADIEGDEYYVVDLSNPGGTGASLGTSTQHTLTITDSDAPATTWTGAGGDSNWNNTANWKGGAVPGNSDIAYFFSDGECGANCDATVNTNVVVGGLHMMPGYSGTITMQATKTLTIYYNHWHIYDGTFVGNATTIQLRSDFRSSSGATVNWNGALFNFHMTGALANYNVETNGLIFDDVKISSGNGSRVLNLVDTWDINGDLELSSATIGSHIINDNGFNVAGDLTVTYWRNVPQNNYKITLDGVNQTVSTAVTDYSYVGELEIASTGTVTFASGSVLKVVNSFTYTSGAVTWNDAVLLFYSLSPSTTGTIISNGLTYGNVEFGSANGSATVTLADPMDIDGDLVFNYGNIGSQMLNGSAIYLSGDLSMIDQEGGSTEIVIDGATDQYMTFAAGKTIPGNLTVNKSAGILYLNSDVDLLESGQGLDLVSGTIDAAGFNLSINDVLSTAAGTIIQNCGASATFGSHTPANGTLTGGCQ